MTPLGARGVGGAVVALTGTPGTGKTAVADALRARGYAVLALSRYVGDARFDLGADAGRPGTVVLDEAALSDHLALHLADELEQVPGPDGPVFIESHLAHLLDVVDRIVVLRCRPSVLQGRLAARGWSEAKLRENLEAEAIDLIVQEAVAVREEAALDGDTVPVGEIDTTEASVEQVAGLAATLARADPLMLEIGTVDWSGEVLGWF